MKAIVYLAVTVMLLSAVPFVYAESAEDQVWAREQAYWQYVKAGDLEGYRSLWHENFLGWPYMRPEPARKAQITDWIKAHLDKGETLESYTLERLVLQPTGDLVTATYRVSGTWTGKNGPTGNDHSRIIHTWIRGSDGTWRIISGMSAPVNADGK